MTRLLQTLARPRRLVAALAFVVCAVGAGPGVALAGPADRIEEELHRTDRALESADAIVREGRSQRAVDILNAGRAVQTRAWDNFREGRLVVARQLTFEARKLAVKAAALARGDAGVKARAQRELEIAETMLRDAVDELSGSSSEPARRLLDEARAQIDRGRTQLGEQNYEAALRLALSAQRLVRQALDLADVAGTPARLERELERTDTAIERATGPVRESEDDAAIRLLERAVELQRKARESSASGAWRVALAQTREARTLAIRALARAHGPLDAQRVREELERTDAALDRAALIVDSSENASAIRLLATARSHQDRARELAAKQDFRAALAQTLVARRLALRSVQMAQGDSR